MPRKARIDKPTILVTAANLINKEGSDALSLNRLASELGIKPPSLYNHIKGLADLLLELSTLNAHNIGECLTESVIGKSGDDAILSMAYAYRNYIKTNQGLYLLTLKSSNNLELNSIELQRAEKRVVSIVQRVLASYHLSDENTLHTIRSFRSVVHGFTTLEIAGGFGLKLNCDISFRHLIDMFIRELNSHR